MRELLTALIGIALLAALAAIPVRRRIRRRRPTLQVTERPRLVCRCRSYVVMGPVEAPWCPLCNLPHDPERVLWIRHERREAGRVVGWNVEEVRAGRPGLREGRRDA